MPRPQPKTITFSIDGREVHAPESSMLVDAAKHGDVEIPVFCYEPKLGQPVGACRMCLVEIEGIPKLQTGCSTPVRDGMVVYTQSERVKTAQRSVVEFLLINHPLDCPVCDKGGECPLQDITFGWGAGISRFIEPKRHFVKPLELSPTIAIDRERCILCYRCVRFSQEVAEDYQLVLLERGAHSYVATFDGHPYVAPFSGNIVELCPVGALTSRPYRFRARPWDIESAGSVCTLCPSQCNVALTVRDEQALRVLARENVEVDDGWLCDKGRFAYQSFHVDQRITEPLLRDGGVLRPVSWERALQSAAAGLARAGAATAAIVGGQSSNEEGLLLSRLLRERLGSPHLDSRRGGALPLELHRALGAPALQARTSDLEFAHAVLVLDTEPVNDSPIFDLRVRKGVRRHGCKLAVATPQVSSLDANAALSIRYAPGAGAAFASALAAALAGEGSHCEELARAAGAEPEDVRALAALLHGGQASDPAAGQASEREVVVLWGERLSSGPNAERGARALLGLAGTLRLAEIDGAGLLEVPSGTNGRGLREAGVLPNAGVGLSEPAGAAGRDTRGIAQGLADGQLSALYLLHGDPLGELPDRELWQRALAAAGTVVAHAAFLTESVREHADVVFPAEAYPEKEGTIVHPDGRLQRLRPAIARPGEVRAGWQVIGELALRLGLDLDVLSGPMASQQLFSAVPFYAGITLEEIGGRGLRWQERTAAAAFPGADAAALAEGEPPIAPPGPHTVEVGAYRSLWDAPEVLFSPALRFLHPGTSCDEAAALAGPERGAGLGALRS
ncbi:MAG TPA: NADH-quinone oxidoreductase subunit NuoG [Solirubrobacteraceae bacterium]|nr:NADH-quinone oxidoreductase subunit NuoG [Solirubrobacteraceae bacterium]